MTNILSIKSILSESTEFYKNNLKDLSVLIIQYCLLIFILDIGLELVQKLLIDFTSLNIAMTIVYLVIFCCATGSVYISITRSIISNQLLSSAFLQNMFSKSVLKIFLYSIGFLIMSAIYFAIPILLKIKINGFLGLVPVVIASLFSLILYVRLFMVSIHIIVKNEINLKYNWHLTKNNFFNMLGLLLICMLPFALLSLIEMMLTILSAGHTMVNPKIPFNFINTSQLSNSILVTSVMKFIMRLIHTYVTVFYGIVYTYTYVHLTGILSADSNNLSDGQSLEITLKSDH